MMRYWKKAAAVLLSVVLSMAFSFCALADVFTESAQKYLIASGSDAVMAAPLLAAPVEPYSSISYVINTISFSGAFVEFRTLVQGSYQSIGTAPVSLGGTFSYIVPSGKTVDKFVLWLHSSSLPVSGNYKVEFDFASDTVLEYNSFSSYMDWISPNQSGQFEVFSLDITQNSGDLYSCYTLGLKSNINSFTFDTSFSPVSSGGAIGGRFSVNFTQSAESPDVVSPGVPPSSDDIQSSISNTTGQIADSVGDMSNTLDSVDSSLDQANQTLNYISESQNLIIQGIDNIILHISDQLYAFWDQLYNLIHVPTMAMLQSILQAIKDLDINVNVDLDELKSAISSMKTAVVSKIEDMTNKQISNDNKNTEDIKNGYNNAGMESDSGRLEASLDEYDAAEKNVLDSVNGALNDFDFDADLSAYTQTVKTVSDFLQALYDSSGGFKIVINLSLLLSIASLVIGIYRFKDGG